MKLSLIARSSYYKGLLVLLKRDRTIDARERELMIKIGEMLDFDKRFCEATINELLSNAQITRTPLVFHDETIKECFFRDALQVAHVDGHFHPAELRWLRRMAQANGRSSQWLDTLIQEFQQNGNARDPHAPLKIQQYL